MWRSRLLPRPIVIFGLIGGPLAFVAGIGVLLGAWDMSAGLPVALTAPEAIWEFSLSVWLLAKGFRPSPILTGRPVIPTEAGKWRPGAAGAATGRRDGGARHEGPRATAPTGRRRQRHSEQAGRRVGMDSQSPGPRQA